MTGSKSYKLSWYINTVLVACIVLGFVVCMNIDLWIHKTNLLYSMEIGLFNVRMGPGVLSAGLQMVLPESLRRKLSKFDHWREFEFDDMHSWVCQIPPGPYPYPCTIWDNLKTAKWNFVICASFGVVVLITAWAMEYSYITKPKEETKKLVRILYMAASTLFFIAMLPYYFCGIEMKEMVPRTEVNVMDRGFWCCLVLVLLTPVCPIINMTFADRNVAEMENEIRSVEKKNAREDARQQAWEERNFGAPAGQPGYGTMPQAMPQAQPMMMPAGGAMVVGGGMMVQGHGAPPQPGAPAW